MDRPRTYIAIDLKSFYASVECVERGLDPLTTNLVVADESRTDKTICLAVSPSLKALGVPGRPRLFEVKQILRGKVRYIAATPRMGLYIKYSTRIYQIYLKYIAPEDIHVYSIDEVFMDVTGYLQTYRLSAHELAMKMIRDVLSQTGITATAGIGTNMYLCKVAMDIVAKHIPTDKDGVRIAELDEMGYRRALWNHTPLTDFWRVGHGIAERLESAGIRTMGQLARLSVNNEEFLYRQFGANAELLIDHAWGWEPCTIAQIKAYRPEFNSTGIGQVLSEPYGFERARVVVKEMADAVALDLVDKGLVTDQMVLTIGFDTESLSNPDVLKKYISQVSSDWYGRPVPRHAHGTANLGVLTSSSRIITSAVNGIFAEVVHPDLLIRRINLTANHLVNESGIAQGTPVQQDLFKDYEAEKEQKEKEDAELGKEHELQETVLALKKKFGKNSILKGMDFEDGATAIERNTQIGGHKE